MMARVLKGEPKAIIEGRIEAVLVVQKRAFDESAFSILGFYCNL